MTSVYLTAADGDALPRPQAGQYLTLRAAGAGDPPPVRSYSLSSSPDAEFYRISVKREPRGIVSAYVQSQLRPGSILDVAAPRGEFVLTDDSDPVLLAMLYQLADAKSTRDVWWIHTARDANQYAFADEAHRLLQSLPRAHERVFYTSVEADAPRELRDPGPHRLVVAKVAQPFVRAREHVLEHVLRVGRRQPVGLLRDRQHVARKSAHQFLPGVVIAGPATGDEAGIRDRAECRHTLMKLHLSLAGKGFGGTLRTGHDQPRLG